MNKLPTLAEGAKDEAGHVFFVSRAQALTRLYGQLTGLEGASDFPVTGVFDAAAKAAVVQAQQHAKITADGVVGPQTWGVLITGAP